MVCYVVYTRRDIRWLVTQQCPLLRPDRLLWNEQKLFVTMHSQTPVHRPFAPVERRIVGVDKAIDRMPDTAYQILERPLGT